MTCDPSTQVDVTDANGVVVSCNNKPALAAGVSALATASGAIDTWISLESVLLGECTRRLRAIDGCCLGPGAREQDAPMRFQMRAGVRPWWTALDCNGARDWMHRGPAVRCADVGDADAHTVSIQTCSKSANVVGQLQQSGLAWDFKSGLPGDYLVTCILHDGQGGTLAREIEVGACRRLGMGLVGWAHACCCVQREMLAAMS